MLLIPESQMKDLIIPPKLINRGITALNDRWHGRNTDELIFRSIKVSPNGELGDKTELVTFPRKAFLTVLSDPKNLRIIESKLEDSRYSPGNVFKAYKKVQVFSAALSATSGSKEQDLVVKEQKVSQKERQLAEQERNLQEQASQLEQERQRLAILEQQIQKQLSMTPVGGLTVNPAVPPVISPEVITNPQAIDPGRPNNNPRDIKYQRLLTIGVPGDRASMHAGWANY